MLNEGRPPGKKSSAKAAQHNARFKEIMTQAQISISIREINKKLDAMIESKNANNSTSQ
jgi:hypothetical protein